MNLEMGLPLIRPRSSSGPASADASSPMAASNWPDPNSSFAAASRRASRHSGSTLRATERSRNVATAATPPRPWTRVAERSSSSATSSSGTVVAWGRCQARRSGSRRGRWPRPGPMGILSLGQGRRAVGGRAHQGWRKTTRLPSSMRPASTARDAASVPIPRTPAARHTRRPPRRRGHQQELLGGSGQLAQVSAEALLDRPGQRPPAGRRHHSRRQLGRGHALRSLQQGQPVPVGFGDHVLSNLVVEGQPRDRGQQRPCVTLTQAAQVQGGEPRHGPRWAHGWRTPSRPGRPVGVVPRR